MVVIAVTLATLSTYVSVVEGGIKQAMSPAEVAELERLEAIQNDDFRRLTDDEVLTLNRLYARYEREPSRVELTLIFAITGLFGVAAATAISVLFARRVTRPIEAVAAAARQIREGDLSARAVVRGAAAGAEIAVLIDDFNALASGLQVAERRLREDAAALAHELRTPLTVLTGRIQALSDGVFEPSPQEFALLQSQVGLLTRIVEDLKMVTLAKAGQLVIRPEPVDLAVIAEDTLKAFAGRLDAAGMAVRRAAFAPAPVLADVARVRQIVQILLENAIVHARSGGVVELETGISGRRAFLRVLDRGPGLPEGPPAELFEPFTRGDASRNRATGGSGLGLAVAAAIARAHGGATIAANRPGGGADIRLDMPARKTT
ncbi:MAG: HAMP domain-containing protein [Alphaproteobacteria bacterium]|nr:HAMP domain-containing protein [Alphaproteobacteria bacterium]